MLSGTHPSFRSQWGRLSFLQETAFCYLLADLIKLLDCMLCLESVFDCMIDRLLGALDTVLM